MNNITKIDHRGLEIELFPDCNLKCNFCFQRNIECFRENREQAISLPKSHYINKCMQTIKEHNLFTDSIELWGGELFYDHSLEYVTSMIKFIKFLNPKLITIDTNLIWNVDDNELFQYLNTKFVNAFSLYVSYDPINRYTSDKMSDLFKKNLNQLFKSYWGTSNGIRKKIELQVLLQPEVLTQQIDLSVVDDLYNNPKLNVTFYTDYRGYNKDIIDHFHELYFNFMKRYPKCRQAVQMYEPKIHDNNFCMCLQPDTVFLTYNNDFKYIKNSSCIYHEDASKFKDELLNVYKCNECKYYSYCKDVCASTLHKLGLLKPDIYCYKKYLYDHYEELK